jgi:parallel beta-helix repeat protein
MKKLICVLMCLSLAIYCHANPIPWPPPASMPLEDMHVEIKPDSNGLHALFTGDFTFDYIPEDVLSMLFPVPPDANNIRVWQDGVGLPWSWSGEEYPTILPEMPSIPMIVWLGPFPTTGAIFRVDYEHDLIKRPKEFIFFYALGTGKYFYTYEKTTIAYFDILLPPGFAVAGVWLDYTPHEYEVVDGHLYITVDSYFGPITNDLIVSLVQTPIYVATDGNDTTGDGSPENPFATIQKAIASALDGHTVIVQPGTYTGPGNRDIDFLGKAVTVQSIDPNDPNTVAATIVDCNGTDQDNHRGFYFINHEGQDSVLKGLTITNGYIELWAGGGGIYIERASPTIDRCIIFNNHAELCDLPAFCYGGGIKIVGDSNPLITHCNISNNSAGPLGYGGGISCGYESSAMIRNCLITNNSASGDGYGGGINCDGNDVTLTNCTIADNSATKGGGGIQLWICDSFTITNCIIWGNSPNQIDIYISSNMTITYSDVQDDWPGLGNIDADPCFADPCNGDYHLKSEGWRWDSVRRRWDYDDVTSWCIDAGNPGCALADELLSVPDDPNNIYGQNLRINMGAYGGTNKASMPPLNRRNIGDLTNDWYVDSIDLAVFALYWLEDGECIPSDLNRNQSVNFADYAIFADNWLRK